MKQFKIEFSSSSDDSYASYDRSSGPRAPEMDDEGYINGDNPFVLQDTSPFELSSSYEDENVENKAKDEQPLPLDETSDATSSLEQFYMNGSKSPLYRPPRNATKIYIFTYEKKEGLTATRHHFQLSLDGIPLFHTKTRSRHPNGLAYISNGVKCKFSQNNYEGVLKIDKKQHFFSLRHKSQDGPEIMTIHMKATKGPVPKRTKVVLKNFGSSNSTNENKKITLVNLKPTQESSGRWTLSFGGKLAIPSIKNCILVIKNGNEEPLLTVRRISNTTLEIDAKDNFPPLYIFAYALSTFFSTI